MNSNNNHVIQPSFGTHIIPYLGFLVMLSVACLTKQGWTAMATGAFCTLGYAIYAYSQAFKYYMRNNNPMYTYWGTNFVHCFMRPLFIGLGLWFLVGGWSFAAPLGHLAYSCVLALREWSMPWFGEAHTVGLNGESINFNSLTDSHMTAHVLNFFLPIFVLIFAIGKSAELVINLMQKKKIKKRYLLSIYWFPAFCLLWIIFEFNNGGALGVIVSRMANSAHGGWAAWVVFFFVWLVAGLLVLFPFVMVLGTLLVHASAAAHLTAQDILKRYFKMLVLSIAIIAVSITVSNISFMGIVKKYPQTDLDKPSVTLSQALPARDPAIAQQLAVNPLYGLENSSVSEIEAIMREGNQSILGGKVFKTKTGHIIHCLQLRADEDVAKSPDRGSVCINEKLWGEQMNGGMPSIIGNAKIVGILALSIFILFQTLTETKLAFAIIPAVAMMINAKSYEHMRHAEIAPGGKHYWNFFSHDFLVFCSRGFWMNWRITLVTVDLVSDVLAPVVQRVPNSRLNFSFIWELTNYGEFHLALLIWLCVVLCIVVAIIWIGLTIGSLAAELYSLEPCPALWHAKQFALPGVQDSRR